MGLIMHIRIKCVEYKVFCKTDIILNGLVFFFGYTLMPINAQPVMTTKSVVREPGLILLYLEISLNTMTSYYVWLYAMAL